MSAAFVLLCHGRLDAAAQLAASLGDRPLAVHVDARAPAAELAKLRAAAPAARHVRRRACDWGMWNLVGATLDGLRAVRADAGWTHATLLSGADMPLRPLAELDAFLADRAGTDFVESVDVAARPWVQDGLSRERFRYYFPVCWKTDRALFDGLVALQRRLRIGRRMPRGLDPHLGAQWWTLSRQTVERILDHPRLPEFERFFRWTWIPDEAFFATLVRAVGGEIDERPLTLARFDGDGRPFVFHDEHAELLSQSDHFFARKIDPRASGLRVALAAKASGPARGATFEGRAPDRALERARRARVEARPGLVSPAWVPRLKGTAQRPSAAPYGVLLCGEQAVLTTLARGLAARADVQPHGRLFRRDRVGFAGGKAVGPGAVPASTAARDLAPDQFLANLARAARGRLVFRLHVDDWFAIGDWIAADPNARIVAVRGAWALADPSAARAQAVADARRRAQRERAALGAARSGAADLLTIAVEDLRDADAVAERAGRHLNLPPRAEPEPAPAFPATDRAALAVFAEEGLDVPVALLADPNP